MMAEMEEMSNPKLADMRTDFIGKKTKVRYLQHTTNRGDDSEEVYIVNLWHLHHGQDQEVTEALGRMSRLMGVFPIKEADPIDQRGTSSKKKMGK